MLAYKTLSDQMIEEHLSLDCETAVLQSWDERLGVLTYKVKQNYPRTIGQGVFINRLVSINIPQGYAHCSCKGINNYQATNRLCHHIAQVLYQESKKIMALEAGANNSEIKAEQAANTDKQLLDWCAERVDIPEKASQIRANLAFERWYWRHRRRELNTSVMSQAQAVALFEQAGLIPPF